MNLNFSTSGLAKEIPQCRGRENFGRKNGVAFHFPAHSKKRSQAAFTMIEIAIALAVIAFALVAIIGVLPTGLNVQKDNREETIINQDGPYFLEAIRNGSKGLNNLTNYVERIGLVLSNVVTSAITTNFAVYDDPYFKNGSNIVGLLSIAKYTPVVTGSQTQQVLRVEAHVRALTGSAAEQGLANTNFAFMYLLVSETIPFERIAVDTTNYWGYSSNSFDWITRSNRFEQVKYLPHNSYENRLTFRWPFLGEGRTGPGRQLFRSMISGQLARSTGLSYPLYFFQPQTYASP